jgi:hypothetical protein
MLSHFTKLLLAITSIAPIFLTFALVELWERNWRTAAILLGITGFAVFLCRYILLRSARELPTEEWEFSTVKPADREITGFVIAYLLPLAKAGGLQYSWPILTVVLVIFFLVVLTSNSYHMNPLIGALGYHFYEVASGGVTYVLISKRTLHHVRGKHRAATVADYMLLDSPLKKT